VKDGLLGKVKDLGDVDRELGGALHTCLYFLSSFNETMRLRLKRVYLKLVHDGNDLVFEGFVGDLPSTEVNLVSDKDDGNLQAT
jgi:hypothetical protein